MTELYIDRLTLRVSDLSAQEGRRLAHLVAEELGRAEEGAAADSADRVSVTVTRQTSGDLDGLARRIAADVLRQLR